jgi:HK97 gp10 family phage protein
MTIYGSRNKPERQHIQATFNFSSLFDYHGFFSYSKMSVDSNFDKIKKAFNKEATDFSEMVAEELDRLGSLMQDRASMDAPVDTGYLASHIEKTTTGKETVTVVATAEYSGYVDKGTSRMAANPFFSRNVELIETQEIPNVEKNIGAKIEADFAIVH